MRILIDTSLLVEGERRNFDLGEWVVAARHEVFICDATPAGREKPCRLVTAFTPPSRRWKI